MNLVMAVVLSVMLGWVPPNSIRASVPVTSVVCMGPCCCGQVSTVYRNHWYSRMSYCRWFVGLSEGQVVTTTLQLWR